MLPSARCESGGLGDYGAWARMKGHDPSLRGNQFEFEVRSAMLVGAVGDFLCSGMS